MPECLTPGHSHELLAILMPWQQAKKFKAERLFVFESVLSSTLA
jgi:hypothetical protein